MSAILSEVSVRLRNSIGFDETIDRLAVGLVDGWEFCFINGGLVLVKHRACEGEL